MHALLIDRFLIITHKKNKRNKIIVHLRDKSSPPKSAKYSYAPVIDDNNNDYHDEAIVTEKSSFTFDNQASMAAAPRNYSQQMKKRLHHPPPNQKSVKFRSNDVFIVKVPFAIKATNAMQQAQMRSNPAKQPDSAECRQVRGGTSLFAKETRREIQAIIVSSSPIASQGISSAELWTSFCARLVPGIILLQSCFRGAADGVWSLVGAGETVGTVDFLPFFFVAFQSLPFSCSIHTTFTCQLCWPFHGSDSTHPAEKQNVSTQQSIKGNKSDPIQRGIIFAMFSYIVHWYELSGTQYSWFFTFQAVTVSHNIIPAWLQQEWWELWPKIMDTWSDLSLSVAAFLYCR